MNIRQLEDMLREYPTYSDQIIKLQAELNDDTSEDMRVLKDKIQEAYNTMNAAALVMIPQKGQISDPTLQAVVRIDELMRQMSKRVIDVTTRINDIISNKMMIDNMFNSLTEHEKRIIELRYFKQMRWFMVSRKAHYNMTYCVDLNKKILRKMLDTASAE